LVARYQSGEELSGDGGERGVEARREGPPVAAAVRHPLTSPEIRSADWCRCWTGGGKETMRTRGTERAGRRREARATGLRRTKCEARTPCFSAWYMGPPI